ncbi:MAG: hypothetical protein QXT45_06845 [Candidatus Bilamarchaeaceae archaeon]
MYNLYTVDFIQSLQRIALHNVGSNTIEWLIERSYRHYSKTYHTPLHIAKEKLTPHEVMLIFFEDQFDSLPPEQQLNWKNKLLSIPDPVVPGGTEHDSQYVDEESAEEADIAELIAQLEKEGAQESDDQRQAKADKAKQIIDKNRQQRAKQDASEPVFELPEDILNFDIKE